MKKESDRALLEQQDEELIRLIQKGSITAVERLYVNYKGLIYNIAINFLKENGLAQMYFDDLVDIGTDTLMKCAQRYTINEDNSFLNYWWSVTNNQFNTFLRKTINTGVIYFDPILVEASDICLFDSTRPSPSKSVDNVYKEIIKVNKHRFTASERVFLEYYIQGLKPLEIADVMGINRSKLYRIKKTAINKLNKIIKSN